MTVLRRRLRIAVAAWLLFQVVSLSALVPRNCCATHQVRSAQSAAQCHETADSPYCAMRGKDRAPCPMHKDGRGHHEDVLPPEHAGHTPAAHERGQAQPAPDDRCAIGSTCSAPMAALAVLLSHHGVLPTAVGILSDGTSSATPLHRRENLVSQLSAPDSPPPRA